MAPVSDSFPHADQILLDTHSCGNGGRSFGCLSSVQLDGEISDAGNPRDCMEAHAVDIRLCLPDVCPDIPLTSLLGVATLFGSGLQV